MLLVETFVAALKAPEERRELTSGGLNSRVLPEVKAIVALCRRMRSVAEVAALLKMPLGVVRESGQPDRALLERVLGGLRRL